MNASTAATTEQEKKGFGDLLARLRAKPRIPLIVAAAAVAPLAVVFERCVCDRLSHGAQYQLVLNHCIHVRRNTYIIHECMHEMSFVLLS